MTGFTGSASGTLADTTPVLNVNVPLQPLVRQTVTILEPDGVTAATNASVQLVGSSLALLSDTDSNGRVAFVDVPVGNYTLRADSHRAGATHSAVATPLALNIPGDAPALVFKLSGVGSVSGTVFLSDGTTPAARVPRWCFRPARFYSMVMRKPNSLPPPGNLLLVTSLSGHTAFPRKLSRLGFPSAATS